MCKNNTENHFGGYSLWKPAWCLSNQRINVFFNNNKLVDNTFMNLYTHIRNMQWDKTVLTTIDLWE